MVRIARGLAVSVGTVVLMSVAFSSDPEPSGAGLAMLAGVALVMTGLFAGRASAR